MTDTTATQVNATARSGLVAPEPDEEGDQPPQFVSNGWIRFRVGGETYKLRRPFLGELRDLEASLDTARRELSELHDEQITEGDSDMMRARELEAEAKALDGKDPNRKAELDDEATRLGIRALDRHNVIARESVRLRGEWWRQAFEMLTPPGVPKPPDVPAWAANPQLQQHTLQHWQSVPLAPGNG